MNHKPMFVYLVQKKIRLFALPAKVAACLTKAFRDHLAIPHITEEAKHD